ncbi:MAG: LptF/LptG family permease [Prevotella sp.]|uniref:LptF/LptG family permease n=1 Tax=Prevotella sp. AGR2160 TaxID=1280674 RepID=UPI0004110059|nr:LptF/LptG family permease [Prevotella sp. AGR2160]MDD5861345.1 LptF/LptG family permease [Prevotella sp.]
MIRIKKLDIFIAKQFGMLFLGTFFICQFVLMMQFLWRYVDDLIGKGLSLEILAQFFWYMGLMLIPQALPLAILLSSLITFGNLGESSELTAIKAAGISLLQSFRGLIAIVCIITLGSFYFQNTIGPESNTKLIQLLVSMKQKSPELEIPEGVFYDGIPNTNIYVQKKDLNTGHLYGIMIYRMTGSYEDAAIILADSGMLQSTAEKKHLVMRLWSGEWFENMNSSDFGNSAAVPYRRETFVAKRIVLDFDGDFNLADAAGIAQNARTKSLAKISQGIDSLKESYDSIGRSYYDQARMMYYSVPHLSRRDSLGALRIAAADNYNIDTIFAHLPADRRQMAVSSALSTIQNEKMDLDFKAQVTADGDKMIREHYIWGIDKFTLSLSCLIFFFIGAPLGAIIRKGGLGVPVIVSVLVFIVYYILDNTGYRMARGGMWSVWFGKLMAPAVLIPLAVFVTYKANNDSVVFNMDAYRLFFRKVFGLRVKRHVFGKEVIIEEPQYAVDAQLLEKMSMNIMNYNRLHHLKRLPNVIRTFFKYRPDHVIEEVSAQLEKVIEDLGNTRDKIVLNDINQYPVLITKSHTRPFEHRWMNIMAAIIIPAGLFFYFRMFRFRLRLYRDLRMIMGVNDRLIPRLKELAALQEGEE